MPKIGGYDLTETDPPLIPPLYFPHLMNAGITREVAWQHRRRHVFDLQVSQCVRVHLETTEVGGEQQGAAGRLLFDGLPDERDMVALKIKCAAHAFRIGKGRRIEKDEIVARR